MAHIVPSIIVDTIQTIHARDSFHHMDKCWELILNLFFSSHLPSTNRHGDDFQLNFVSVVLSFFPHIQIFAIGEKVNIMCATVISMTLKPIDNTPISLEQNEHIGSSCAANSNFKISKFEFSLPEAAQRHSCISHASENCSISTTLNIYEYETFFFVVFWNWNEAKKKSQQK